MLQKNHSRICVYFAFSLLIASSPQSLRASKQISECIRVLSTLQVAQPVDANRITNLLLTLEASRDALSYQLEKEKDLSEGFGSIFDEATLQAMADGNISLDPKVRRAHLPMIEGSNKDDDAVRTAIQRALTSKKISRSENLSPVQLVETENKITSVIQESLHSIQPSSAKLKLNETRWRNQGVHAVGIEGSLSAKISLPPSTLALVWSSTKDVPSEEFLRTFTRLSELGFGPQYFGQLKIPTDDKSSLNLDVIEDPSNWKLLNGAGSDLVLVIQELTDSQKESLLKMWRILDQESLYAFEYSIYEDQTGRLRILPTRPYDSKLINRENFIEDWNSFHTGLDF